MFQKNMTNQSEPGYNREGVFDNFRLSNPGALRGPFCSIRATGIIKWIQK